MTIRFTHQPTKQRQRGLVRPYYCAAGQRQFVGLEGANDFLYGWAEIVANLLANTRDGSPYYINGMYFEFDNSGAAVNPTPTIERSTKNSYYAGLSGTKDYLRMPITLRAVTSTDETNFPAGNAVEFYAETSGIVGENGLAFSNAAGSRVYGVALVAMRDAEDPTQDLVFNQYYYAAAQQLTKLAGDTQIGARWRVEFL